MREHIQTAWTHIRRSPYQALAAAGIMTLTFFLVSVLAVGSFISEKLLRYAESQPQVSVYFKDEASEDYILSVKQQLEAEGKVERVVYISKEEALKIYQMSESVRKEPLLLEMVTAKLLPASLDIATTNPEDLIQIAKTMSQDPLVESVEFFEEVVKKLMAGTETARKFGIIFVIFMGGEALIITLIIVGIRTSLRREEVDILALLGATSRYIQAPFLLEGIFYGLVGAILGWGIGYLLLLYSTPALVSYFQMIPVLPISLSFMGAVLGAEILTGMIIGTIGSFIAVKRFLR